MGKKGFSLPEILIGLSIGALILTLILKFAVYSGRMWKENDLKIEVQQSVLTSLNRILSEIQESHPYTVTMNSDPFILSFCVPERNFDSSGKALWRKFVIFYHNKKEKALYRKEWPPPPPQLGKFIFPTKDLQTLRYEKLQNIILEKNGTEKKISGDIEEIKINEGTPILYVPSTLTIKGKKVSKEGKSYEISVSGAFRFKNLGK